MGAPLKVPNDLEKERSLMVSVELIVRPREGIRDPQGDAVEESLKSTGFQNVSVHGVGRTLRLTIHTNSVEEATAQIDDMCRRLLVNPNLETYEIRVL